MGLVIVHSFSHQKPPYVLIEPTQVHHHGHFQFWRDSSQRVGSIVGSKGAIRVDQA